MIFNFQELNPHSLHLWDFNNKINHTFVFTGRQNNSALKFKLNQIKCNGY